MCRTDMGQVQTREDAGQKHKERDTHGGETTTNGGKESKLSEPESAAHQKQKHKSNIRTDEGRIRMRKQRT